MVRKYTRKQAYKKVMKRCFFCGEEDYALLDLHRIKEGKDGGTYDASNTVTTCCRDHRRIHDGQIVIDRKYKNTTGSGYIIHYWEDGEEKWLLESP